MKAYIGLLALLGLYNLVRAIDVRANLGDHKIFSFEENQLTEKFNRLLQELDADSFGRTETGKDYRLSPEAVRVLKEQGHNFVDKTEHWLNHFEQNFKNPNLFCDDTPEACAGRTLDDFYSSYQSEDAIITRLDNLIEGSDVVYKEVIGQSFEGRNVYEFRIADEDETKPLGFIFCTIHAREWLTPMFCSYLIETLVTEGHPLLDTFALAVVPVANPDGYEFSRTRDNLWRKTRMPNPGSSCVGTDGNRNWDNNHCGVGSSSNPCSQTYCGKFPFDQIEVSNLNQFSLRYIDRLIVMLDIHSYGSYVIHAFGYTEVLPPEEDYSRMRQCARWATEAATAVNGDDWEYGTTPQVLGYSSGGTSKDYYYGNEGIAYSYTVELRGPNFQPNPSNIVLSNNEAFALFEGVFSCAKDVDIDGNGVQPTPPPTPPPTRPCNFIFC